MGRSNPPHLFILTYNLVYEALLLFDRSFVPTDFVQYPNSHTNHQYADNCSTHGDTHAAYFYAST